ncbi:MAG: hypothetical protein WCO05_04640, partial [Candidatus Moraniibacteriota bacterium]
MENKIDIKKRNLSRGRLGRVLVSRGAKKLKFIFAKIFSLDWRRQVALFVVLVSLMAIGIHFASKVFGAPLTITSGAHTINYVNATDCNYDGGATNSGCVFDSISVTGGATLTIQGGVIVNVAGNVIVGGDSTASKIVIRGRNITVDDLTGVGVRINAVNVTVGTSAFIDANGGGYASLRGPGKGANGVGASYGGRGSVNSYTSTYGSRINPINLGSGGYGTVGGGAIDIEATGTLTVDGTIRANGGGAGASGGSILLNANLITDSQNGTGVISADSPFASYSDSGGGGRIAFTNACIFTGTMSAIGATCSGSGCDGGMDGTINNNGSNCTSITHISHNMNWYAGDPTLGGQYNFTNLTIDPGITITVNDDYGGTNNYYSPGVAKSTVCTAVNTPSGCTDATDDLEPVVNVTGTFTLSSTAIISATGKGYWSAGYRTPDWSVGGLGPGAPLTAAYTIGAGHGGLGGGGVVGSGGSTYDTPSAPVLSGSGGGTYDQPGQGAGGGAIKLVVGNAVISGTIVANGVDHTSRASGPSGGSIWIDAHAGAFSGNNGILQAKGGASGGGSYLGGGGGMIAVQYLTYSATGMNISASGATISGANGTIIGFSPTSAIIVPSDGSYKNSTFSTITGTAVSPVGTLSGVQVSIKDVTDGTHWYNGSNFTTATSEQWLNASGTTNWTFTMSALTDGHTYLIRSKSADNTVSSPETPGIGNSFIYDISNPNVALSYG